MPPPSRHYVRLRDAWTLTKASFTCKRAAVKKKAGLELGPGLARCLWLHLPGVMFFNLRRESCDGCAYSAPMCKDFNHRVDIIRRPHHLRHQ